MLTQITKILNDRPYLAFDMEGTDLGRAVVPCYLQIRDCYHGNIYLIDVLILNSRAFTTPGLDGLTTLQEILEDERLIKMIHDCRQDFDTLFHHFGVKLAGVCDIQLMSMLVNATACSHSRCSGTWTSNLLNSVGKISQAESSQ